MPPPEPKRTSADWTTSPEIDVQATWSSAGDPRQGHDYMHARFYSPQMGRFFQVDPVLQVDRAQSNPQLWNRYAYAINNPLKYIDPSGRRVNLASMEEDERDTLLAQLSEKSGFRLLYNPETGDLLILGGRIDGTGALTGSATARRDLLAAVISETTYYGISRNDSSSINMGQRIGSHLNLDFSDIAQFQYEPPRESRRLV